MATRNHLQIHDRDFFIHSQPAGNKKYEEGRFVAWENPRTMVTAISFMVEDPNTGKFIPVNIDTETFNKIALRVKEIQAIPVTVEFLNEYMADY